MVVYCRRGQVVAGVRPRVLVAGGLPGRGAETSGLRSANPITTQKKGVQVQGAL